MNKKPKLTPPFVILGSDSLTTIEVFNIIKNYSFKSYDNELECMQLNNFFFSVGVVYDKTNQITYDSAFKMVIDYCNSVAKQMLSKKDPHGIYLSKDLFFQNFCSIEKSENFNPEIVFDKWLSEKIELNNINQQNQTTKILKY